MKRCYTVFFLMSLVSTIFSQADGFYNNADQAYFNHLVEVIDGEMFLIEDPADQSMNARISKVNDQGNKTLVFDEASFNNLFVYQIQSFWKQGDEYFAITQFINSVLQHSIGLMILNSDFEILEIKNTWNIRGQFVNYETKDKIWNPHLNRFEWILAIRNDRGLLINEILRLYMDNNTLVINSLIDNFDTSGFFHALINETTQDYIINSGNDIVIIDSDFSSYRIYELEFIYDGVTYVANNFILTSFNVDTFNFYVRRIGLNQNHVTLSFANAFIRSDTIIAKILEFDLLEDNRSTYLVYQNENDFDDSRFVLWGENLLEDVEDSLRSAVATHFAKDNNFKRTIRFKGTQGYVSDIEFVNDTYYGCGLYFFVENTNFYFIIDNESDFITGSNEVTLEIPKLVIYPNPTNDYISVSGETKNIDYYSVNSINGQRLISKKPFTSIIDLNYPPGIYIITLFGNNGLFISHKVVIQ